MPMEKDETFQDRLRMYKNDLYPGHFLFGVPELEDLGYKIIYSFPDDRSKIKGRLGYLKSTIRYTFRIISQIKSFDIIYSPYPNFLQIIIFLRAFKLFPKRIIIYQHSTILKARGKLYHYFIRRKLYFRGIDKIVFFDQKSAFDSLESGLISKSQIFVAKWGPNLEQYQRISEKYEKSINSKKVSFISTGRDSRDFELMFDAFKVLDIQFEFYLMDSNLVERYKGVSANINVYHLESNKNSPQIALNAIINADVSVIICKPTRPTCNGYTALCEAMGLGKPVILTKNPFIPIDVDKERIGITVPIGDIGALQKAILFFNNNPEIVKEYGDNARKFAEDKYNSKILGVQLDNLFKKL